MDRNQSNVTRLQTSLQATWLPPGIAVTTVTHPFPIPFRRPVARNASLNTLPNEPEDARLTGGTRSLGRRLLALNLSGPPVQEARTEQDSVPTRSAVA